MGNAAPAMKAGMWKAVPNGKDYTEWPVPFRNRPVPKPPGKLRVLCLHGITMNSKSMKWCCQQLEKDYGKFVEFVYMDAPFDLVAGQFGKSQAEIEEAKSKGQPMRTWERNFKWDQVQAWQANQKAVQYVFEFLKKQQYFDGWLGFSQGTIMINRMLLFAKFHRLKNQAVRQLMPRFVVEFGGPQGDCFILHTEDFKQLMPIKPQNGAVIHNIKSLHIHGATDRFLRTKQNQLGPSFFKDAITIKFPGGHEIPCKLNVEQAKQFYDFLNEQYKSKNGAPMAVDPQSTFGNTPK